MTLFESSKLFPIIDPPLKSCLRYPGGKSRAVKHILPYFPDDIDYVVSPFFGGGSIELALVSKGIPVLGFDIFVPLVMFWQQLLYTPQFLISTIQRSYPLSKPGFYDLQKFIKNPDLSLDKLDIAAYFFILNRASFSGTTLSGGMSPGHPRFTQESIDRLLTFENVGKRLFVRCEDFQLSIPAYSDTFLYLDPPYLIPQKLYGISGDCHENFDHSALANLLLNRRQWILSYNDCEEVRKMYDGCKIVELDWAYGMSTDKQKKKKELLIMRI